jgi:hypothetical protein
MGMAIDGGDRVADLKSVKRHEVSLPKTLHFCFDVDQTLMVHATGPFSEEINPVINP